MGRATRAGVEQTNKDWNYLHSLRSAVGVAAAELLADQSVILLWSVRGAARMERQVMTSHKEKLEKLR